MESRFQSKEGETTVVRGVHRILNRGEGGGRELEARMTLAPPHVALLQGEISVNFSIFNSYLKLLTTITWGD